MRRCALEFLLFGIVFSIGCKNNTKSIPTEAPTSVESPAFKSSSEREIGFVIEREDHGHAVAVTPKYEFRSGDRFRLRLHAGFPAYVYVVNRGSNQSTCRVLFPAESEKGRNPLKTGASVVVPIDAEWLRLDQSPGNEYLTLIASTVALPELEQDSQIPRDVFDADLAKIDRSYQPDSSRRIREGDSTNFFAARDGDLALIIRLALQHD